MKDFFAELGFLPQGDTYTKEYPTHGNYQISIDFDSGRIDYHKPVSVRNFSSGELANPENLVILECVDRLLEKGYPPQCLVLEMVCQPGKGRSGRVNIVLNGLDGKPFLMIECREWGHAYEKEQNRLREVNCTPKVRQM